MMKKEKEKEEVTGTERLKKPLFHVCLLLMNLFRALFRALRINI